MTKILCTLGPSSLKKRIVEELAQKGVHLFRINLSHTNLEDLEEILSELQSWSDVPICLDSEGAQVRNTSMTNENVMFEKDALIKIHRAPIVGDNQNISFTPAAAFDSLHAGDKIAVDFNSAAFVIQRCCKNHLIAKVTNGGSVGSNKGAVVNRPLKLAAITPKDMAAFELGLNMGVENFALSFTHRAEDTIQMRELIGDKNLISKIESIEGIKNILEILPNVDQILIDRGDLSREILIEKIPFIQRALIALSKNHNTPVYVATNLLESMITSRSPTRAETNDVASTLLMGASGLVLAAETAIGRYPVACVEMINSVIEEYENWSPKQTLAEIMRSQT